MTLRTASTLVLVAFACGAFAGYRFAVDRLAEREIAMLAPGDVVPAGSPATVSAAAVARPDAPVAPAITAARTAPAASTPPTLPRPMPPGPDPTQMSHGELEIAVQRFFEEEGEDPAWRAATESQLTNYFYREHPLGVGATLTSVECRATICKVEAASLEKDAQNVLGPRSTHWDDLIAFYSRSRNDAAGGPMRFTLFLRPTAAFVAAAPHP